MFAAEQSDLPRPKPIREYRNVDADLFKREIKSRYEPAVMRGLVADWPAVKVASGSLGETRDYIRGFDCGEPVQTYVAPAEIDGRFFYGPGCQGYNFQVVRTHLGELLERIVSNPTAQQQLAIYMGSTGVRRLLPGWESANPMPLLDGMDVEPRIWLGTATNVAAHFDSLENIACVVGGRRRFTLFPPDQVENLYVGPLDHTIAGTPASLVDLTNPDLAAFPRIREALEAAQVAELEPGDAIYMPPVWWHHVQAFGDFNILVNYWWDSGPADAGSPLLCLGHGLLSISQLPEREREAWRTMFDYYVFRRNGDPAEHIPTAARGILGESTRQLRQTIRQYLIRMLSQG
jgi:hypothetical protein